MMRIITGSARGTKLQTLEGEATRPTSERVKEAVFNMLQFNIEGRRVLDLFGGSGQMALEALSRGAAHATIVDESREAVNIIKANAQKTKLFDKCVILTKDYMSYLKGNSREKFDIIFLDPPYDSNMVEKSLDFIIKNDMLAYCGVIVIERGTDKIPEFGTYVLQRHIKYGRSYVTILVNEEAKDEQSGISRKF